MMKKLFFISALVTFYFITNAQIPDPAYRVHFKSGRVDLTANTNQPAGISGLDAYQSFNGRRYLLLQFNALPDKQQKAAMQEADIHLLTYIPYYTFISSVPEAFSFSVLTQFNLRAVAAIPDYARLSTEIYFNEIPGHCLLADGMVRLMFHYFRDIDVSLVQREIRAAGWETGALREGLNSFTVVMPQEAVDKLVDLPWLEYAEPVSLEGEPEDIRARALHRSNVINSDLDGGLKFNGEGVSVAIADDGSINHIDFTGRLVDHTEGGQGGSHGDMTSGICIGAGNLNALHRGTADGAILHLYEISGSSLGDYPHIENGVSYYQEHGTVITSTSYAQTCNQYNGDSEFGDNQVFHNGHMIHSFSAGNNGTSNCGYGAGSGWGNITGGYKMGKNVLACANLNPDATLVSSSSKGPGSDGRIKPDIAANGNGQMSTAPNNTYSEGSGTSAASPGVAGVVAQLYHAYKDITGDTIAPTGLLKACLLNTAGDLGNPGPDFKFGWGHLNGWRAYKIIQDGAYTSDSIGQNDTIFHSISVPAGTARLKVMTYWHDYPGTPAAAHALVNDINTTLTAPNMAVYQPLVLNSTPSAALLNLPAAPGNDSLNNMEQIVVYNPVPGTYTLRLHGYMIPQGPQRYFIVYDIQDTGIDLTYPRGGEGLVPGETNVLRWDAVDTTGVFAIEYSTDNGTSWTNITTSVPGKERQFNWAVPSTVTSQGKIRISRNGVSTVNVMPYTIIGLSLSLQVVFECPDSIGLSWNAVTGAIAYEVSMLGDYYMDSVGTSAGTSIVIPNPAPGQPHWFSVKAIAPGDGEGRRRVAVYKAAGNFNCPNTGINELSSAQLSVYPNPSEGMFRIEFGKNAEPRTIKVFDPAGRLVSTEIVSGNGRNSFMLDLRSCGKGIYFLEAVLKSGDSLRKKLVVD